MYKVDGKTVDGLTDAEADVLDRFNHDVETVPDGFGRHITSAGHYSVTIEDVAETLHIRTGVFNGSAGGAVFFWEDVVELRDALTEWLNYSAAMHPEDEVPSPWERSKEITADSPEPDRTKRYMDLDGDTWRYNEEAGGWYFGSLETTREAARQWSYLTRNKHWFPWTPVV